MATAAPRGKSSQRTSRLTSTPFGATTQVIPSMTRIFEILLPMRFPTATSRSFFIVATIVVASSGAEVPMAIMVSPMIASETPSTVAISTAPETSKFAPRIVSAIPIIRSPMFTGAAHLLFFTIKAFSPNSSSYSLRFAADSRLLSLISAMR